MGKNKSALESIFLAKCPRCREGNMFKHSLVHYFKFAEMNSHCPHCNLRFEREPGFFIGAMYVSYAFSVALIVTITVTLYNFFGDPPTWVYITIIPTVILILLPVLFRYARVLYLHWFGGVRYQPEQP